MILPRESEPGQLEVVSGLSDNQAISFHNVNGEKLAATLHLPEKTGRLGAVMGHCFTCSRHTRILGSLCDRLAEAGFIALRFDFSGNGQSEGDFTETSYTKHISEMHDAIELVREKGARWIGLAGHSMGAALAILTGAEAESVGAVCTLAGRYKQVDAHRWLNQYQQKELEKTGRVSFNSRGRDLQLKGSFFDDVGRYDLANTVRELNKPLLIVHGDRDEIIPVEDAYAGRDLNPEWSELAVIEGADHMFLDTGDRDRIADLVTRWFIKQAEARGGAV